MITQLIGQICFNKFEHVYWSTVGRKVLEHSKHDLIWRKIGRRIIKQQNSFYLESLIRLLLLNADHYEQIEWYLGADLNNEETGHNSTIRHLLTNKFLLISHFSANDQTLVDNIVGYLINFNVKLFEQTLHNVITVWSNATAVRHLTKDQHYYLCRILICCLKYMIKLKFRLDANRFQSLILHSAEVHLKMVELDKRNRGLFVVEKLMNYLNRAKLDDKLDFEIELNDEIRFLIEILEGKQTESASTINVQSSNDAKEDEYEYSTFNDQEEEEDLMPYDMSNDTRLIKTKKPIYLKDCLEGLMNTEDPEYNSTCLQCLPDLIDKNRAQASELAVDFVRVLLFLDKDEDEELKECRFKTMVKLCNLNPMNLAHYLTDQIYDRNLSIVRKLEVLDMIVESARELSSLEHHRSIEDTNKVKSIQNIVRHSKPEYERIIEERLKSKTKILCSSHKLPLSTKNEFIQYVTYYFYPLINRFDRKDVTLKFEEDDYFVLGKLILTLAELLKSVSQTHLTRKMAIALVEFLNVFKHHPESYVRKAITMCIHSILTNVPNYFLFEELQPDLLSLRDFLLNLKQLDPETFHSHGVLTLYALEEQINDYQNSIRLNEKMKQIQMAT